MSKPFAAAVSLLAVLAVLASGCVGPVNMEQGLVITMDSPSQVIAGQDFNVYVDAFNNGNRTYDYFYIDMFNTGGFLKLSSCKTAESDLRPNGIRKLDCELEYDRPIQADITEYIEARVKYMGHFSSMTNFLVMGEDEYELRRDTGILETGADFFTYYNEDLAVDVEIESNPVVIIPSRDTYVHITIRNIGEGFVSNLVGNNIIIRSEPEGLVDNENCDIDDDEVLIHNNGVFPRISCLIDRAVISGYNNAYVFAEIDYEYEIRRSASIYVTK